MPLSHIFIEMMSFSRRYFAIFFGDIADGIKDD
jgi:hypothetical protein